MSLIFVSGQKKKSITKAIKKKIKIRNAIEQVNSILKNHHRLRRNYLKGEAGFGYNFKKILAKITNIFYIYIFSKLFGQIFPKFIQIFRKIKIYLENIKYILCKNGFCRDDYLL